MHELAQEQPAVLSVAEALQLVGSALSRASFYSALSRGEIPHRRVGRRILIPRVRFLQRLEASDSSPVQK